MSPDQGLWSSLLSVLWNSRLKVSEFVHSVLCSDWSDVNNAGFWLAETHCTVSRCLEHSNHQPNYDVSIQDSHQLQIIRKIFSESCTRLMKYWMSTWLFFFVVMSNIDNKKYYLIIMSLFSTFLSLQIIICTILIKDVYDQEAIRLKGSFHYWLTISTCCICQVSWDPPVSRPGGAPAACPLIWDESWERSHHQSTYHETETKFKISGCQKYSWK